MITHLYLFARCALDPILFKLETIFLTLKRSHKMKHPHLFLVPCYLFLAASAAAAVPHRWTVETSRISPEQIEAYRGETLALEATLNAYGKPLETALESPVYLYWQTNGMGAVYWVTNAEVKTSIGEVRGDLAPSPCLTNTVLSASFLPSFAPAASAVQGFIGSPSSSYRASFVIRFRNAPGATPNTLPLPVQAINFDTITVYNPPYYTKAEVDEKVASAASSASLAQLSSQIATNAANIAAKADATNVYTKSDIDAKGFLNEHQSLADYAKTTTLNAFSNELAAAIANAEPGNYAAVSNAAINAASSNALAEVRSLTTANQKMAILLYTNKLDIYDANLYYASKSDIPTKVSELTNDVGYLVASDTTSFNEWVIGTNITLGLNAQVLPDHHDNYVVEGVAIGPNTYGMHKSLSTAYDTSHIYLGSIYTNGIYYGTSLQDILDKKFPAIDGTNLMTRVTTAESSIKTINSAGYITQTQADSAYYPKASGDAWSSYWDGDDVRVTVTNYDSVAHLPSLYLEQRTNDTASASSDTNAFRVVWREMTHWDAFLGSTWNWEDATWKGFDEWRASLSSQLDEKADRAWGFYDSHTGSYAPDGYTSISSSNVMICAGASYQKTATATCDVWVLTANEPYEATGVSTNGGFQIKDADGNVQVEIVKGDKRTVKAQAGGVSVTNSTLYVVYNVVSSEAPTGEVCLDLGAAEWKTQGADDCPATVVWSGSSGAWVAAITPTTSTARCFFKATYVAGGDDYVNSRVPVALTQLVIDGTTYTVGTATIDGNTVLTLTPAN